MCCVQTKHCLLVSKKEHNSFIVAVVQYKGTEILTGYIGRLSARSLMTRFVWYIVDDTLCMIHCGIALRLTCTVDEHLRTERDRLIADGHARRLQ